MVDLHTHSNISDGNLSPALLIREAVKQGLSAIALTDHDTINGLEISRTEAEQAGIRFISGIEISIQWDGDNVPPGIASLGPEGEFHLLGLGIRCPSPAFLSAVAELSRRREERNREIVGRMNEMGIEASMDEIKAMSGGHSLGRLHFASLLVNRKIVENPEQAFSCYLKPGRPLYVPKTGLIFEEAAALIRESCGIPVLAHPQSLSMPLSRIPDMAKALKDRGLMGIEAWHPAAQPGYCRRFETLGKSLGLYITEGSDYHGSIRPERKLGHSSRNREIKDAILEAIPDLVLSE
jgi:predicted metal-dependent phosphoesterase TrpH